MNKYAKFLRFMDKGYLCLWQGNQPHEKLPDVVVSYEDALQLFQRFSYAEQVLLNAGYKVCSNAISDLWFSRMYNSKDNLCECGDLSCNFDDSPYVCINRWESTDE